MFTSSSPDRPDRQDILWLLLAAALPLTVGVLGCSDDPEDDTPGDNDTGQVTDTGQTADTTEDDANLSDTGTDAGRQASCAQRASRALTTCVESLNTAWRDCYTQNGEPCAEDDAAIEQALTQLESDVEAECGRADDWAAEGSNGGFGNLEDGAVTGRLQNACRSEAASLSWRTFGGPQGAVWEGADQAGRTCLSGAHRAAATMIEESLAAIDDCVAGADSCDAASVSRRRQGFRDQAMTAVEQACDDPDLDDVIAVDRWTFLDRATRQADCLAAAAHPASRIDAAGLELSCGPSNVPEDFDWPRGEYVQVTLDQETWGARCADGSDYAFQVRLAPEGEPLDRVIIGMQGGGVCVFSDDCRPRFQNNPGLFKATDDDPPTEAIFSNDPEDSPFADYTKVYLPYCTQDVHIGGGAVETFGDLKVRRYGAINVRTAVRLVRDVLWKRMDAAGGDGFRPDEVVALFGGWSAGGYGTLYNYHWLIDDLQWPQTAALPDASLALDNGETLGVKGLGQLKVPAWDALEFLPSYCFAGECAVGPVLYEAMAPRLEQVPRQQFLIVSNPRDRIQQGDAFFGGADQEDRWINAIRQSYCDTRDLTGINYYFTNIADESLHVVTTRPRTWTASVDGLTLRDWFARAIDSPDMLQDRVVPGDFAEEIDGVQPFPCELK